jgi:hypothetical protein
MFRSESQGGLSAAGDVRSAVDCPSSRIRIISGSEGFRPLFPAVGAHSSCADSHRPLCRRARAV